MGTHALCIKDFSLQKYIAATLRASARSDPTGNMETRRSHCVFGIIADVQYADTDNGTNYAGDRVRYFRDAASHLQKAVTYWSTEEGRVDFVLQLGDIIDGRNNRYENMSQQSLDSMLQIFNGLRTTPVHHLVGNHELYNFSREYIKKCPLNSSIFDNVSKPTRDCMYYTFKATEGLRVVILDTYEVSVLGIDKGSAQYKIADKLLEVNPNSDRNDPTGLPANSRMFVAYNGGISETQLAWLDRTLANAVQNNENVIVAGHQGIHKLCSSSSSLTWSHKEILSALERHKACVVAYLCGHDHDGGYYCHRGIHIINVPGVIETPPNSSAFATAQVFDESVEITGSGRIENYKLPLKYVIDT